MRVLGLVVALLAGVMALAASCSYKPLYQCADGGCWGEPTDDAGLDASGSNADASTPPDTATPADATSPAG